MMMPQMPYYLRHPGDQQSQPEPEPQEQAEEAKQAPAPVTQAANLLQSVSFPKNWAVWVMITVGASALIALLMSMKPDKPSRSGDDDMSDFMFERWLHNAFRDDDDDDRPRRREHRDDNSDGWRGYIPPIIINNPGQQPHILGGKPQGGDNNAS